MPVSSRRLSTLRACFGRPSQDDLLADEGLDHGSSSLQKAPLHAAPRKVVNSGKAGGDDELSGHIGLIAQAHDESLGQLLSGRMVARNATLDACQERCIESHTATPAAAAGSCAASHVALIEDHMNHDLGNPGIEPLDSILVSMLESMVARGNAVTTLDTDSSLELDILENTGLLHCVSTVDRTCDTPENVRTKSQPEEPKRTVVSMTSFRPRFAAASEPFLDCVRRSGSIRSGPALPGCGAVVLGAISGETLLKQGAARHSSGQQNAMAAQATARSLLVTSSQSALVAHFLSSDPPARTLGALGPSSKRLGGFGVLDSFVARHTSQGGTSMCGALVEEAAPVAAAGAAAADKGDGVSSCHQNQDVRPQGPTSQAVCNTGPDQCGCVAVAATTAADASAIQASGRAAAIHRDTGDLCTEGGVTAATTVAAAPVLGSSPGGRGDGGRGGGGGGGHAVASIRPVTVLASPLALLSDVGDLTSLTHATGALGAMWTGTWRGQQVAIKLTCCTTWGPGSAQLQGACRASRVSHPNLVNVYDIRLAVLDKQAIAELDPPPVLRPGWQAAPRPAGRLQRFLQAHAPPMVQAMPGVATAAAGPPSLTVYPGDLLPPSCTNTPAQRALCSLRLRLGASVVVTIMEHCDMGSLCALACAGDTPFHASRSWPLHVAQRALLRTAREVAAGIRALHAAGVAHGALTPSNVLLSRSSVDRRGFIARVSDACSPGLAHAASNPLAVMGPSMVFIAPEALADGPGSGGAGSGGASSSSSSGVGAAVATAAADAYSYGMLLYVMAAGEMPFAGQHLVPVLMAVSSDGLRPEWPTGQHDHLEPLFRICVAHNPEDRPTFNWIYREIYSLENQIKSAKRARAVPRVNAATGGAVPGIPAAGI